MRNRRLQRAFIPVLMAVTVVLGNTPSELQAQPPTANSRAPAYAESEAQ